MDLLITVAGLFVAIYAVVPRDRQLDLRLRVSGSDWVVFVIGSLAILYLQFYEFFKLHDLTVFSKPWFPKEWFRGITLQNATYLVLLAIVLWFAAHLRLARLSKRKIGKFQDLAEELYWAESYSELFALLQKHHKQLFNIYQASFPLSRLREYLTPDPLARVRYQLASDTDDHLPAARPLFEPLRNIGQMAVAGIATMLPSYERQQKVAEEIIRTTLLSPRVVDALTRTRPYLGLDLIREWKGGRGSFDFVELYIKGLLKDTTSILYAELANNQNISRHQYYVNPSNRLLYFFLADTMA